MGQEINQAHKEEEGFWMVYVDGEGSPKVKHYHNDDAKEEAKRLAKKTEKTVYVLYACDGFKLQEPPVVSFRTT